VADVPRVLIRWIWHWAPAVAQMAAIFAASSLSSVPSLPGGLSDYTGHFIGYMLLSALAIRGFARGRWRGVNAGSAWKAVVLSSMYGVTDELHQSFVSGRHSSIADWLVDTLGACVGVGLVMVAARFIGRGSADRGI
jgi:VanZ family protein